MGQNPMVYNSIDMTASNVHTANEKVIYTTQAVPAEIRKTVTTTTKRYL
jgi:hypothetical protein